jgi:hypothetical protein
MFGLSRSTVVSLAVAFGLAIVGVVLVQRSDSRVVDYLGLLLVVVGVMVAALTKSETDTS